MELKYTLALSSFATSREPRPEGTTHVSQAVSRQRAALRIHARVVRVLPATSIAGW